MEVLWRELEVFDTRGSTWKYIGVYGSSWNIIRNIFVEAATGGIDGSFHLHRQGKLPCISVKASNHSHGSRTISINLHVDFQRSKSTSTDFHGRKSACMEVNLLPWELPWKLVETSVEVD